MEYSWTPLRFPMPRNSFEEFTQAGQSIELFAISIRDLAPDWLKTPFCAAGFRSEPVLTIHLSIATFAWLTFDIGFYWRQYLH